jgi:NAD(P)-dependent dehydrogenase (short-subunit alcohol dehydrogenase family)
MLLENKHAVVYGAGSIGRAFARGFAREGAHVHLAGRTLARVEAAGAEVGAASTAQVDALDARAVDEHAQALERIDISVNAISIADVQGTPMVDMEVEDYLSPIVTAVRSTFLTMRAAARRMRTDGGGTILIFGGSGPPLRDYSIGGLQCAFEALESMRRQLSMEMGRDGVRVVTLRTGGVPESIPSDFEGAERLTKSLEDMTMLGRCATLDDIGRAAAFAASDWGRTMTAATINVSCGALID